VVESVHACDEARGRVADGLGQHVSQQERVSSWLREFVKWAARARVGENRPRELRGISAVGPKARSWPIQAFPPLFLLYSVFLFFLNFQLNSNMNVNFVHKLNIQNKHASTVVFY
jgi:hypothetical protein